MYFRGITSVTRAENSMAITIRFAAIILPQLVVLTGIVRYRFTRRTLLPVANLTETVKTLRRAADLSQRVVQDNGMYELSHLSKPFDTTLH